MTPQTRKRPMRRLVAHFLRPELCFGVAEKSHPYAIGDTVTIHRKGRRPEHLKITRQNVDRVRSISPKAPS
jgi:hypothetical protein